MRTTFDEWRYTKASAREARVIVVDCRQQAALTRRHRVVLIPERLWSARRVLGDHKITHGDHKITHGIEGLDSGVLFLIIIRQTTEHEDMVGRWLKHGVN